MNQFTTIKYDIADTEYNDNHKITGNTLYPSIPIKKEIDTTMDDFDYSIKLDPLSSCMPIKNDIDSTMHNINYSTKIEPRVNIKQEIDTGGDEFDYNTEAKVESKAMGVEQFLSNLFSKNTNNSSFEYPKASKNTNEAKFEYPRASFNTNEASVNYTKASGNNIKGNYFKCQHCDYTGSSWSHYKNHRQTHKEKAVKKQLYQCNKCNKFFQQNDVVVKHKGRGRSKISKHFKCVQCEKDPEVHSVEKFNKCSHCEMIFDEECKLTMHMTLHTGPLQPNQCSQCGKSCVSQVGLARHRRLARH